VLKIVKLSRATNNTNAHRPSVTVILFSLQASLDELFRENGLLYRNKNLSTSCVQTLFTGRKWVGQNRYFWLGSPPSPVSPPLSVSNRLISHMF